MSAATAGNVFDRPLSSVTFASALVTFDTVPVMMKGFFDAFPINVHSKRIEPPSRSWVAAVKRHFPKLAPSSVRSLTMLVPPSGEK